MFTAKNISDDYNKYISKYPFIDFESPADSLGEEEIILLRKCVAQMTFEDIISVPLRDVAAHVMAIKNSLDYFDYCKDIPEEIIFDFVLPFRTNDEAFGLYAPKFFDELKNLVKGKSRREAAKEINYWCLSKATYAQADDRTKNALATYNSGKGRCGEESVFCVAALRSVGIPARQVYSPFWSHCDDNHAWVEVYTENGWEFMGACEPEEILNYGWFNNASGKALAVRYRKFGYNENAVNNDGNHIFSTHISTPTYGETHKIEVNVTVGGKAAENIPVGIYVINYNMPKLILEKNTDEKGRVFFDLGMGDFIVFAKLVEDYNFTLCKSADNCCNLELTEKPEKIWFDLKPSSGNVNGVHHTPSKNHLERVKALSEERIGNHPVNTPDEYKNLSGFNYPKIEKFLSCPNYSGAEKTAVLKSLTEKDFSDITFEVLLDIASNLKYAGEFDGEVFSKYLLPLRVGNEPLYPHREYVRNYFKAAENPIDIYNLLSSFKKYDEYSFGEMAGNIQNILKHKAITKHALNIHFVQICRALGIPAKINPETNLAEYFSEDEDEFIPVCNDNRKAAALEVINQTGEILSYGENITINEIGENGFTPLDFEVKIRNSHNFVLNKGMYIVTVSKREIDGAVYGYMFVVNLKEGDGKSITLEKIKDRTKEKLMCVSVPSCFGEVGGNCIIAYIENAAEPTEHFLNEIQEKREELIKNNVKIRLFTDKKEKNEILSKALENDFVEIIYSDFTEDWENFRREMNIGDLRLPFITAVKNGKALYSFANYNVGTVTLLNKILSLN